MTPERNNAIETEVLLKKGKQNQHVWQITKSKEPWNCLTTRTIIRFLYPVLTLTQILIWDEALLINKIIQFKLDSTFFQQEVNCKCVALFLIRNLSFDYLSLKTVFLWRVNWSTGMNALTVSCFITRLQTKWRLPPLLEAIRITFCLILTSCKRWTNGTTRSATYSDEQFAVQKHCLKN